MNCATISAPMTHAFNPTDWLKAFERTGGAYARDDRLCLFIVPPGRTDEELSAARQMIATLGATEKAGLETVLRQAQVPPHHEQPDWNASIARWRGLRQLEENHPFGFATSDDPRLEEYKADHEATLQRSRNALQAILSSPAPTIGAVADKIALLIEDDPDKNADSVYAEASVLATIVADCRRLAFASSGDDQMITEAFALWQQTHREKDAIPDDLASDARLEPFWKEIDTAEELIRSTPATTPAGIAAKLWIALEHDIALSLAPRGARDADIASYADDTGMDWSIRLILSALRSLDAIPTPTGRDDDAVVRYWAAFHAHNAGRLDEDAYFDAFQTMWNWTPVTPMDFVRKFEAAYSLGGCPTEENQAKLVEQAIALLGSASRSREA